MAEDLLFVTELYDVDGTCGSGDSCFPVRNK